jgi:hypothetical protein
MCVWLAGRYERENKELGLVLFPDVLETIARIDRVISEPGE